MHTYAQKQSKEIYTLCHPWSPKYVHLSFFFQLVRTSVGDWFYACVVKGLVYFDFHVRCLS